MPLQPAGLWVHVFLVKPLLALDIVTYVGGGLQAIRDATGATALLCERPGGLEGQSPQLHMMEVTSPDADADGFKTAVEMLERCLEKAAEEYGRKPQEPQTLEDSWYYINNASDEAREMLRGLIGWQPLSPECRRTDKEITDYWALRMDWRAP